MVAAMIELGTNNKRPDKDFNTKLIAFGGKARAGKTTCGEMLDYILNASNPSFEGYTKSIESSIHLIELSSFAERLKEAAAMILNTTVSYLNKHKQSKLKDISNINSDITVREFMQALGKFGRNLDLDIWAKSVDISMDWQVIIDDLRFQNEAAHIHSHNGIVVKVIRDFKEGINDSDESEVCHFDWDALIKNDGSLEDLYNDVVTLVKTFNITGYHE